MFLDNKKNLRTDLYGKQTERIATDFLVENGYKILERNFLCPLGEIDIIAKEEDRIIFVEVKARNTNLFGKGRDAINNDKIRKIKNASIVYLKKNCHGEFKVRYDLIEIENQKVTAHLKSIF